MQAVSRYIQMVLDDGNICEDEAIRDFLQGLDADKKITVISIIGSQNSGKSTLLNALFGTDFKVLTRRNRGQTTRGIWVARCSNNPYMFIMDVEGSDSRNRVKDACGKTFQYQAASLAMTISDVLLLNIKVYTLDQVYGCGEHILTPIFQRRPSYSLGETKVTKVVATLRDCEELTDTDDEKTVKDILKNIWDSGPSTNGSFDESIMLSVVHFPHATSASQSDEFESKVAELREKLTPAHLRPPLHKTLTVATFLKMVKDIWKEILKDENLKIRTLAEERSRSKCERIMQDAKTSLYNRDTKFSSMKETGYTSPGTFKKDRTEILNSTLEVFDGDEAAECSESDKKDFKAILERHIVEELSTVFLEMLMNIKRGAVEERKKLISKKLKETRKAILPNIFKFSFKLEAFDGLNVDSIVQDHVNNFYEQFREYKEYKEKAKIVTDSLKKDLQEFAEEVTKKIKEDYKWKVCIARIIIFGGAIGCGVYFYGVNGLLWSVSTLASFAAFASLGIQRITPYIICIFEEIIVPAARNAAEHIGMVAGEHIEKLVYHLAMSMLACFLTVMNRNIGERNVNAIDYYPSSQRLLTQ